MASIVDRVKNKMSVIPYVEERKLSRGIGFLLRGSFFIGIWNDSLMVKLSHQEVKEIISMPFVTLFDEIEKAYIPNVALVGPQGIERDEQLDYWINRAMLHVETKGKIGRAHLVKSPTILDLVSFTAEFGDIPTEASLFRSGEVSTNVVRLRAGQSFKFQTHSQPMILVVAAGEAAFKSAEHHAISGIVCFLPPYSQLVVIANSDTALIVVRT